MSARLYESSYLSRPSALATGTFSGLPRSAIDCFGNPLVTKTRASTATLPFTGSTISPHLAVAGNPLSPVTSWTTGATSHRLETSKEAALTPSTPNAPSNAARRGYDISPLFLERTSFMLASTAACAASSSRSSSSSAASAAASGVFARSAASARTSRRLLTGVAAVVASSHDDWWAVPLG